MRKDTPEALKGELAALSLSLHWVLDPKRRSKVLWRIRAITDKLQKRGIAS
ncbi:MAG TPA: hypothetical protein VGD78_23730 [Chthoniobacterales bacterium]